ncbi:MAG: aminotransferase class V-fold PLP-dependent enzyme [Rhodobacteraceae bacterium]|nr:aminotransferase class V-fold PLP-dependent enzyme [Paracoccaceae bacterium]
MTLNFGRPQLSIPGPSVIPDRVLAAMHRPSPNIYEGELVDMTTTLYPDLKTVAQTKGKATIYISNGHGAWEAAICNSFSKGDKVLVLVTGNFGLGWATMARELGIEIELLDFGLRRAADPQQVLDRLKRDKFHEIKAVMTVQTDTATSAQNGIAALRSAIDDAQHPARFMVDCIASLGCDRHEMDNWGVDVMVAACQKGLMTPPGLGFLFFNEKAAEAQKTADLVTPYWDWHLRSKPDRYYQLFGGTPPVHLLYGLREALNMLVHEEGIQAAWARHERFARALWAAVEAWGEQAMTLNIAAPDQRSHAVTLIRTNGPQATPLRQWCAQKAGLTLGISLGIADPGSVEFDSMFRVGHMGHLNVPMMMGTIGTIDAGLKALGIPHGSGACDAAAQVISEHNF